MDVETHVWQHNIRGEPKAYSKSEVDFKKKMNKEEIENVKSALSNSSHTSM
jgi:hypothetical protein